MASDNRHPTGDAGAGAVIRTRRIRKAQDLVADVAASETDITAEAAVVEGEMVQKPTPHQDGQKTWCGGQNRRKGGRSVYTGR